jgi:hypothetical protein
MKSLAALSRRRLHISIRLSLKFLPAFIRTEKIFLSRKLRVEFTSVLVNFHSANWILRHRSPPFRDLLSSSPGLSAKLLPFSVAFQVADPIRFFVHAFVFFTKPSEKSPLPVHLIPTANHPRNHDVLLPVHAFELSCSATAHLAESCFSLLCI